jgi:hypothetical protein
MQSDGSHLLVEILDTEKHPRPAHLGYGYIHYHLVRYADGGAEEWVPSTRVTLCIGPT